MHIRNIFKDSPPDFKSLSEEYPEFKRYVEESTTGKAYVNFKDPASLRALSTVLLKKYFDISLDVPLDRLVPTIPLRLNYIHWIEDLVDKIQNGRPQVRGIDIGCGASCVYALLAHQMNKWKFLCTEIDQVSYNYALKNIELNNAQDDIKVTLAEPNTAILSHLFANDYDGKMEYEFCMCNPPFFSEVHHGGDESVKNRTNHRPPPPCVSTASDNESFTAGGEVEFVKKMINESLVLKHRIFWYTSMVGKKSSIKPLTRYLKEVEVETFTTTEFQQGRTTRWGIAWSYTKTTDSLVSLPQTIPKKTKAKPFYLNLTGRFFNEYSIGNILPNMSWSDVASVLWNVGKVVQSEMQKLEIEVEDPQHIRLLNRDAYEITGTAFRNTWIHQRHKKRKLKQQKSLEKLLNDPSQVSDESTEEKTMPTGSVNTQSGSTAKPSGSDTSSAKLSCNNSQLKRKFDVTKDLDGCDAQNKKLKLEEKKDEIVQCLFKFSCTVGVGEQFGTSSIDNPTLCLLCLEGDREEFHQMMFHLKNIFHAIQHITSKKNFHAIQHITSKKNFHAIQHITSKKKKK